MMIEQWARWEPIKGLSQKYWVESISDSLEGFTVSLFDSKDQKKKILMTFQNSVDAYRSTNESFRLDTYAVLNIQYGDDFYGDWTFFKVLNSMYVQSLVELSGGAVKPESLMHFSLFASDSVVDIIATYEPKVEFIENKPESV